MVYTCERNTDFSLFPKHLKKVVEPKFHNTKEGIMPRHPHGRRRTTPVVPTPAPAPVAPTTPVSTPTTASAPVVVAPAVVVPLTFGQQMMTKLTVGNVCGLLTFLLLFTVFFRLFFTFYGKFKLIF